MGSADVQGELWGRAPDDWASLQESQHVPLFDAMLDVTGVGEGVRLLDVGCGGGGASFLAAERGAIVSGLDASAPLIDIARERVPSRDFRSGTWRRSRLGTGRSMQWLLRTRSNTRRIAWPHCERLDMCPPREPASRSDCSAHRTHQTTLNDPRARTNYS